LEAISVRPRSPLLVGIATLAITFFAPGVVSAAGWSSATHAATGAPLAVTGDDSGHLHFVTGRGSSGGMRYVTNASGHWKTTTISTKWYDSDPSIAIISGKAYVAFDRWDDCDGCAPLTSTGIMLATNRSGSWKTSRLTSDGGILPQLRTQGGHLHLVYESGDIRYMTNKSGHWTNVVAYHTAGDDGIDTIMGGVGLDLAMDPQGHAHIAFDRSDEGAHAPGIRYTTNTGGWHTIKLDGSADRVDRIVRSSNGKLVIGVKSWQAGAFRVWRLSSGNWTRKTTPATGSDPTFSLDSSGRVHLVDTHHGVVYYAPNTSGGWKSAETVNGGGTAFAIRTSGGIKVIYQMSNGTYVRSRL
jgi:hypothetical protein